MNAGDLLKEHHIKKTNPRIGIIQALQQTSCALSEAEIKEKMGDLYDRITFYRNVQILVDCGIIHKIIINNTLTKYALNKCEHGHCHATNHIHFYCTECQEVTCLDEFDIDSLLPKGYISKKVDVLIQGICKKCSH